MTLRSKLLLAVGLSGLLALATLAAGAQTVPAPPSSRAAIPAPHSSQPQPAPVSPSSSADPSLTLAQAEALALKNHPQIQYARYNALASGEIVREVRSAYSPEVFGDITGSVADRDSRLGAGFLSVSRLWTRFGTGLTIDQLITDSGRTPNLVASSKLRYQAAQQDVLTSRDDVLLAVNQAFFEVLRDQALLKVAQKTVGERQVVVDQVTAMYKNQLKSKLDLSFVQVNLAQAQLLEISAQNNVEKAFAQLSRTLGTSKLERFSLAEPAMPQPPPPSGDVLVAQAMANRPELASLRLQLGAGQKFQRAERDLSFPTVAGEGDAGAIPAIAQLTLPNVVPNHYEAAAINVSIPVFNGHLFAARRAAAMMQERAASQKLRDMQERIARDVRLAWADSTTDYQQIAVTQKLLDESRMALALAQGRYNLGLGSVVELTQAQLSELQAEIRNVNAKYDYQVQNAVLQFQVGNLK